MRYSKRFRAPRVLFIGCGRTALGLAHSLKGVSRFSGLITQEKRICELQQNSIVPILGNAAYRKSLKRIRGLAQNIFIFTPPSTDSPPKRSNLDVHSHYLSIILRQPAHFSRCFKPRITMQKTTKIIYASTTGVYGDYQGAWVKEHSPKRTAQARSIRRLLAEKIWLRAAVKRQSAHPSPFRCSILRISGIYGPHLLPFERVQKGVSIFTPEDDRYTNHIALTDLVNVCRYSLFRGKAQRVYNVSDAMPIRHSTYMRALHDLVGAPPPVAVDAKTMQQQVSPMMWSFLSESRQVDTQRLQQELKVPLKYPTTQEVLQAWKNQNL